MILKLTVSSYNYYTLVVKNADKSDFNLESILSVLHNPSFENSQPSWVRRSQHIEDVDQPGKGVKEDIKTEFDDEGTEERALLTMV